MMSAIFGIERSGFALAPTQRVGLSGFALDPTRCVGLSGFALSGLMNARDIYPGRCPGLLDGAPSGLPDLTSIFLRHCFAMLNDAPSGLWVRCFSFGRLVIFLSSINDAVLGARELRPVMRLPGKLWFKPRSGAIRKPRATPWVDRRKI